jgi:hypothetical protein
VLDCTATEELESTESSNWPSDTTQRATNPERNLVIRHSSIEQFHVILRLHAEEKSDGATAKRHSITKEMQVTK